VMKGVGVVLVWLSGHLEHHTPTGGREGGGCSQVREKPNKQCDILFTLLNAHVDTRQWLLSENDLEAEAVRTTHLSMALSKTS
jgi:hypothetical protein